MKMNPTSQNLSYWWSGSLAFFSTLSLQDYVFVIGAVISAYFTVKTYYAKRREEKENLEEERRRTQLLADYLSGVSLKPEHERPASVEVVAEAIERMKPREQD
ncbi:hypothetical protein C5E20_08395 [Pectobacterium parmentieri]|uniref:hypothetical protein n=1 Tax=Pectobacterium parmentieri TaxID=1905730 RepID=UPI000EB39998|nr:hypothetical protein [Pectobacterium parmentieri]AYH27149.1 hypothetical protein C5E20_08395 [Pectobacterium parmentieri]